MKCPYSSIAQTLVANEMSFCPRYAMLARYKSCPVYVCLCLSQADSRNVCTNRADIGMNAAFHSDISKNEGRPTSLWHLVQNSLKL